MIDNKDMLTQEKDINRYSIMLLGNELAGIVYCLTQVDNYQYIEQLYEDLHQQVEAGYQILEQYDDYDWVIEDE